MKAMLIVLTLICAGCGGGSPMNPSVAIPGADLSGKWDGPVTVKGCAGTEALAFLCNASPYATVGSAAPASLHLYQKGILLGGTAGIDGIVSDVFTSGAVSGSRLGFTATARPGQGITLQTTWSLRIASASTLTGTVKQVWTVDGALGEVVIDSTVSVVKVGS